MNSSILGAALGLVFVAGCNGSPNVVATPKAVAGVEAKLLANSDLDLCWEDTKGTTSCMYTGNYAQKVSRVASLDGASALVAGSDIVGLLADGTLRSDSPEPLLQGAYPLAHHVVQAGYALSGDIACWIADDGTAACSDGEPPTAIPVTGAKQVAVSFDRVCVLRGDGTVNCWRFKVLVSEISGAGEPVAGIEGATRIALGYATGGDSTGSTYGCAIVAGGSVSCWGDDAEGQVGDGHVGGTTTKAAAVLDDGGSALAGAVALDLREAHSCAVLGDGTVRCWGVEIFASGEQQAATAIEVPGVQGATEVALGQWLDCALASNTIVCWYAKERHQAAFDTVPFSPK